jgi:RNA polymerase sigma factor (sigma-70 family)
MVSGHLREDVPNLRPPVPLPDDAATTDGQLLERFARLGDRDAFSRLVQRHGPMVLGVCFRVLNNEHDADDAFQATFLVLARRASAIRKSESVGSWLYGVAYRIAVRARSDAARRRVVEGRAEAMVQQDPVGDLAWQELRPVLDEELARLPAKYRVPLVLCYLEGKTNTEAAAELGWTKGTVSGRLARARDLLRNRLTRRGLKMSAVLLALLLSWKRSALAVSPRLLEVTVKAASLGPAKAAAIGVISERTGTMALTALRSLALAWMARVGLTLLALVALVGLSGAAVYEAVSGDFLTSASRFRSRTDVDILQGAWDLESRDGRLAKGEIRAVFLNDRLTFRSANGGEEAWNFTLDNQADPPAMDLSGDQDGRLAIYRFQGDVLLLRMAAPGGDRPRGFYAPGGGGTLFFFRRPDDRPADGCRGP